MGGPMSSPAALSAAAGSAPMAEDGAAIEMELELDSLFDTETVQVVSKVNAKALQATGCGEGG